MLGVVVHSSLRSKAAIAVLDRQRSPAMPRSSLIASHANCAFIVGIVMVNHARALKMSQVVIIGI
jgi:hypothetical protein